MCSDPEFNPQLHGHPSPSTLGLDYAPNHQAQILPGAAPKHSSLLEMKFLIKIFRGVWAVSGVTLAGAPGNIGTARYKNPGQLYVTRKYYLSSLKNT